MYLLIAGIGSAVGALISAVWDDDDENNITDDDGPLRLTERAATIDLQHRYPDASPDEIRGMVRGNMQASGGRTNYSENIDSLRRDARALYSIDYDASQAEINRIRSRYGLDGGVDNRVGRKDTRIYNSIDPSDDADSETEDSFSFETETENIFGPEQMASSEEDIQAETDIRDPSSVDPIDEISQDEEVRVDDTTTTPESEISVTEEVFFQEAVIYPDLGDYDIDPTDDAEELFAPDDEYRPQEDIEWRLQWMEDVLDDAVEQLDANTFENHARTFFQDDSDQVMLSDESFFPDDINNPGVIDFSNLLDDVGAVDSLIAEDTFGNAFFEWIQAPGTESLDIDPAPAFQNPYGVIGGIN